MQEVLYFSDDDGYTIDRRINEVKGLHGTLLFSYRPIGIEPVSKIRDKLAALQKSPNEELETVKIFAGVLAKRLVSWNVRDHKGNNVPIDKGLLCLHPVVFQRLVNIVVWSRDAGDEPEVKTDADKSDSELASEIDDIFATPEDHRKN